MSIHLPRIIAVCGLKRSGKDTIADILVDSYGYKKIKIAEHLKKMLHIVFGFSEEQLETSKKDEIDHKWGVSPRVLMQYLGTEVMQYDIQKVLPHIGRTIWIQKIKDTYIDADPSQRFVISDLRFKHEYDILKAYNPLILKVIRDNTTTVTIRNEKTSIPNHSSEVEFNDIPYSYSINNNTDINDLKNMIHSILLEEYKKQQHYIH